MKRIFRLNGKALLNYTDYKKVFDPLAAFEQLDSFLPFATVHLVPLPLVFKIQDGSFAAAKFWDKYFWYQVLEDVLTAPRAIAADFLDNKMKDQIEEKKTSYSNEYMGKGNEVSGLASKEKKELQVKEKLDYVRKYVKDNIMDESKSLCLLAICEISDEDIRNYDLKKEMNQTSVKPEDVKITDFPKGDVFQLEARTAPYKFRNLGGSSLPKDGKIRTVKIKAKGNADNETSVIIQLYDNKKLVQTVKLESGEYRFANVCNGAVIKFLPTISVNKCLCVYRKNYYDDCFLAEPLGEESFELDISGEDISMISAGYNVGSYAYIIEGNVVFSDSYINRLDYNAKTAIDTNLEIIREYSKAVEVEMLENNGYVILLEDGSVMSSNENISVKGKRLVLSNNGRAGYINYNEEKYEEAVSDTAKTVFCIRRGDTREVMLTDEANLK